jgi:DNA (cytosine-5)-methyltransferase 1
MRSLTLGSLFDGSGGFPLGGLLGGITPLWASEIEPFPIRVTTKRLPQVAHYGDINQINGATVPPVDIITGGFCCQDLSVAGKRAGLHGARSGLFFQVVRIIKEMRAATKNEYPKFAVLENVPGIYSSNSGLDFLEVLNELCKIKDKTLSIPMPKSGKWSTAGEIVGDDFSLGWRTFDAQFWGVAQRRRRSHPNKSADLLGTPGNIVVDFTGERAGSDPLRRVWEKCAPGTFCNPLFDESRLRGNPPQGGFAGQTAAGGAANCVGTAIAFEPGAASRLKSKYCYEEITGTLRAAGGEHLRCGSSPSALFLQRSSKFGQSTAKMTLGKSKKPKSRNQIVKWLRNPYSDGKEYQLWGNGVSLPIVVFVLGGIAEALYISEIP